MLIIMVIIGLCLAIGVAWSYSCRPDCLDECNGKGYSCMRGCCELGTEYHFGPLITDLNNVELPKWERNCDLDCVDSCSIKGLAFERCIYDCQCHPTFAFNFPRDVKKPGQEKLSPEEAFKPMPLEAFIVEEKPQVEEMPQVEESGSATLWVLVFGAGVAGLYYLRKRNKRVEDVKDYYLRL